MIVKMKISELWNFHEFLVSSYIILFLLLFLIESL